MNDHVISKLISHREKLLAYVRKEISNPELAEDVLQDSLLKALRVAPDLRDEDKLLPWFYRILNNAITDFGVSALLFAAVDINMGYTSGGISNRTQHRHQG